VSHQFLHCLQVYPTHYQTASKGVPQSVPCDVLDLRLHEGGREPLAGILDQLVTLRMEKAGIRRKPELLVTLLEASEDQHRGTVEGDEPVAAVFGYRKLVW
jgi:hypothetical protein